MEEGSCQLFFLILKAVLLSFILLKHETMTEGGRQKESTYIRQNGIRGGVGRGAVNWGGGIFWILTTLCLPNGTEG